MDPRAGLRILVADDDHDTVESMALLLGRQGHEILVAYDGLAALTLARRKQPDLVLLDLAMPKLDGYVVARELRLIPDFQHVVIACVSGYGSEADRACARDAGCDTHLLKPVAFAALEALIRQSQAVRAAYRQGLHDRQRLLDEAVVAGADLRHYWDRFQVLAAESAEICGRTPPSR
jgi:DNA-binding response OmpR family regulator